MLTKIRAKILRLWRVISLAIVIIATPIFTVWILFELYYAATATTDPSILFHKDIIIAIAQGATLLYLIFTLAKNWEMADATRAAADASQQSVQQMIDVRDEETAPYVLVYFNMEETSPLIYLIIKNIGKTPARNIRIDFDPPLQSTQQSLLEKYSPLVNGIPSLAPGQEIRTWFDLYRRYSRANYPKTYTVKLSYYGGISDKQRGDEQVIDLSMYEGRIYTREEGIADLVKVGNDIRRTLGRIAEEIRDSRQQPEQSLNDNDGVQDDEDLPTREDLIAALIGRPPFSSEDSHQTGIGHLKEEE